MLTTSPSFYEDTHLEIIDAQKVMSGYGLKSAILVSSPYHMRRIKLIVMKVFDTNKGDFYFVPTHYEKAPANFWELSLADWKKVRKEYGKILWFFLYFRGQGRVMVSKLRCILFLNMDCFLHFIPLRYHSGDSSTNPSNL